ncbi:MAG: isopentenyl-diphosphate Delta-isomerase [Gammaproteobacteria bacterium]|nr:isopentenyl-diphosphate Delta-isomerase [Gammaproteobacteria bacterium]
MICDLAKEPVRPPEVSSDKDLLVLVDALDRELGYLEKDACHDGEGALHRAFSVFVFNDRDELLLQQRSMEKRLWPGYWSNSCCSHPVAGEALDRAVVRRVEQELGMHVQGNFLYKFIYQAQFEEAGSEHEMCHVFWARSAESPHVNKREVAAWRWLSAAQLSDALRRQPESFTPWLRLEWPRILEDPACPI